MANDYQKAVDAWTRYHQHKMITDRQREAAQQLFRLGEITALSDWTTLTRAQSDRRDCPECREPIKTVANLCHFCKTVLAPACQEN